MTGCYRTATSTALRPLPRGPLYRTATSTAPLPLPRGPLYRTATSTAPLPLPRTLRCPAQRRNPRPQRGKARCHRLGTRRTVNAGVEAIDPLGQFAKRQH